MAIETVRRSDISGEIIEPGTGAQIRIQFFDRKKPDRRIDVTDAEAEAIAPAEHEVATRPERRRDPDAPAR